MARPTRAVAEAIEAAKAAPKYDGREVEEKFDAGRTNSRGAWAHLKNRRALFQFKDGTYSTGERYVDGNGTEDREKAAIKTVEEWYNLTSWYNNTFVEVLKDEPPKPREDGTMSYLSDHFDDAFIGLINDSPTNPLIRGYIMKKLKVMPEASLDTFDKLKEWIEKTFPVPERKSVLKKGKARSATVGDPEVSIDFSYSDTEYGKCDYKAGRIGRDTLSFNLSELRELIEDGFGKQELIDNLIDNARNQDWPDMAWDDDGESTDSHESSDYENPSVSAYNGEKAMMETIIEFLHQNAPELAERLEENS